MILSKKIYEERKSEINKLLELFFDNEFMKTGNLKEMYDLIKEGTLSSGKRLRPLASVISYGFYKNDKNILLPSLALELLHTHTLILDDFMDEDDFRRGIPTIHKRLEKYFENVERESKLFKDDSVRLSISFSVMISNIINILSRRSVMKSEFNEKIKNRTIGEIDQTLHNIYRGQMLDLIMENKERVTEEDYFEMIGLKTAMLFGTSFKMGALLGGADEYEQELFFKFGQLVGKSFQIQDDLLDLTDEKGHKRGSDIRKGKHTLLMIKSKEKMNEKQIKIIKSVDGETSEESIEKIIKMIYDTGAVNYCKETISKLNREAQKIVEEINIKNYNKKILVDFCDFITTVKK